MTKKIVVFDIGGTQSRVALFEDERIVWRDQAATPSHAGPEDMVNSMVQLCGPVAELDVEIGVAITGQIVNGCVTAHNPAIMANWQSFPLQQHLSARLKRPVQIFNDARAAAWGEFRFGSGQDCHEFLFLTVSTGVGAGLILNRRLHIAQNGFDAEIGEMKVADGDTLENHASGTALNQLAARHGYGDAKLLCDAADQGDPRANSLYESGIRAIAAKLADLAVMLGIQRVAIGGSVGLRPGYLDRLQRALRSYPPIYQIELVAARLGHDAGLIGAADLIRAVTD
jgi:N-acylmannosamine kinase